MEEVLLLSWMKTLVKLVYISQFKVVKNKTKIRIAQKKNKVEENYSKQNKANKQIWDNRLL